MKTNHQMNYYDYGKDLDIQGVMPVIGGGVNPEPVKCNYLTFKALEDNSTIKIQGLVFSEYDYDEPTDNIQINVEYSLDNGETWEAYESGQQPITLSNGESVKFRGENENLFIGALFSDGSCCTNFVMGGSIEANGDITSLLNNEGGDVDLTGKNYCFNKLFKGCTALTIAPELPATTLAEGCYDNMFEGCTSLVTAPELPATTLAERCYGSMFYNCTSLETAPELPATTLAYDCYEGMFEGCTSLVTAPELPATTLANSCYCNMFYGCTSLVTTTELPATTLADSCYGGMFYGCTSLVTAPELPATTLATYCYRGMFEGCTSLVTAPELPATTLADSCYRRMFNGCTSLNSVTVLYDNIDLFDFEYDDMGEIHRFIYTDNWLSATAGNGTFKWNGTDTITPRDGNTVPSGWTIETL